MCVDGRALNPLSTPSRRSGGEAGSLPENSADTVIDATSKLRAKSRAPEREHVGGRMRIGELFV